jgi:N-acetylmuramoyl-L-alanine amidase
MIVDSLLPINQYSRPGRPLVEVRAVVVHYLGKPGQRAADARAYWATLGQTAHPEISASAHYIVDLDGTVLRTVPESEKAYHVGSSQPDPASGRIYTDLARDLFGEYAEDPVNSSPNRVTLGVELCHLDEEGHFAPATRAAAIDLVASLCARYRLDPRRQVLRHFDVVGWKHCPRLMVDHPEALDRFRDDVAAAMAEALR